MARRRPQRWDRCRMIEEFIGPVAAHAVLSSGWAPCSGDGRKPRHRTCRRRGARGCGSIRHAVSPHGQAEALPLDFVDLDAVQARLRAEKPFDILVNNAGTNRLANFTDVTIEDFDAVMTLNLPSASILMPSSTSSPAVLAISLFGSAPIPTTPTRSVSFHHRASAPMTHVRIHCTLGRSFARNGDSHPRPGAPLRKMRTYRVIRPVTSPLG